MTRYTVTLQNQHGTFWYEFTRAQTAEACAQALRQEPGALVKVAPITRTTVVVNRSRNTWREEVAR